MLFCADRKIAFIHIARTAGTSIERRLSAALGLRFEDSFALPALSEKPERVAPPFANWARRTDQFGVFNCKHATARQICTAIGKDVWDDCITFSVVRDPADRLISIYSFYRHASGFEEHPVARFDTFDELLSAIIAGKISPPDLDRQWHSLVDDAGNIMVKYTLRFEYLADEIQILLAKLQLPAIEFEPENGFPRPSFTEAYPKRLAEELRVFYPRDTKLWRAAGVNKE